MSLMPVLGLCTLLMAVYPASQLSLAQQSLHCGLQPSLYRPVSDPVVLRGTIRFIDKHNTFALLSADSATPTHMVYLLLPSDSPTLSVGCTVIVSGNDFAMPEDCNIKRIGRYVSVHTIYQTVEV